MAASPMSQCWLVQASRVVPGTMAGARPFVESGARRRGVAEGWRKEGDGMVVVAVVARRAQFLCVAEKSGV
uniref:Uncharacterized protein n=1 Tax=Oryza brachyantha TaxID=4533 RepID=J3M5H9_ORYBR